MTATDTSSQKKPLTDGLVFGLGLGAGLLVSLYLTVLATPDRPGFIAGWCFAVAGAGAWLTAHAYDFVTRRPRFVFAPAGIGKLVQLGGLVGLFVALLILS